MREEAAGDGGFLFGLEMHFANDYPRRRRRPDHRRGLALIDDDA